MIRNRCRWCGIAAPLLLALIAIPGLARTGVAGGNGGPTSLQLPFEAHLDEQRSIVGLMNIFGERATILSAFLVFVDSPGYIEFDLDPETSNYSLTAYLATNDSVDGDTIMVIGYPKIPPLPAPGLDPPLDDGFLALLALTADEDAWGTVISAMQDDIALAIDETEPLGRADGESICDLVHTLPVLVEWVYKLSNTEWVYYRIYEDGSLEVVVRALDKNGCWYWKIYPITIPGDEEDDVAIIGLPIRIDLEYVPIQPPP